MAEQTGRMRFLSWLSGWTNPASPPLLPPPRPQSTDPRPLLRRPLSQPQLPSPLTSQPPSSSQIPSPSQQASQTQPPPTKPTPESKAARPPSPARTPQAPLGTPTAAQPQSPSRTSPQPQPEIRLAASPPSPSSESSQPQEAIQVASGLPSGTASQQQPETPAPSQPSFPFRLSSESEQATGTTPQPPSPPRAATQPQSISGTTSSPRPPSPSHAISQSQLATQTASRPSSPSLAALQSQPTSSESQPAAPTQTASRPTSPSEVTSNQQSREDSQQSPSNGISPQTESPSTLSGESLQPKQSSQPLSGDARTAAEDSTEPVQQLQTSQQSADEKAEIRTQPADVNKATEVLETEGKSILPPQGAGDTAVLVETIHHRQPETEQEATKDEKLKTENRAHAHEESKLQEDKEPTKDTDGKLLDIALSSKVRVHSDMKAEEKKETATLEAKQLEEQAFISKEDVAPTGSENNGPKERRTESGMPPKAFTPPREEASLQKKIREGVSRSIQKIARENRMEPGDEQSASVITLAGENRGASLKAGSNAEKKEGHLPIQKGYTLRKGNETEEKTETEGSSKGRPSIQWSGFRAMCTCINNNIQSINNSIFLNSSCSERSPGVHLVFSSNRPRNINPKEKKESSEEETHKPTTENGVQTA